MFADAIEMVGGFTRPIKFVTRRYKEQVLIPGSATMFFVNEEGYALTCKHVAMELINADKANKNYRAFHEALAAVPEGNNRKAALKKLELQYNLRVHATAQELTQFPDTVDGWKEYDLVLHPDQDLALLHLKGFEKIRYHGHAVFAKNAATVRPGDMLCRLGFPFPEFSDYRYNEETGFIEWVRDGRGVTPRFPMDGMLTRHIADEKGRIIGFELSTPGLRGQSGGPLFDRTGLIYGMQSQTKHLHLGFDMKDKKMVLNGREETVNNQPFLHVGSCVHVDVIKAFLDRHHVKYYVGDEPTNAEPVNG